MGPLIHEHGTATLTVDGLHARLSLDPAYAREFATLDAVEVVAENDAYQKREQIIDGIRLARAIKSHLAAVNYHAGLAEQKDAELNAFLDQLPEEVKSTIKDVLDGEPTMHLDELERQVRA